VTWVVTGTWLDYDFPETVGNITIIPTDEQLTMIFQRGRAKNHQPVVVNSMSEFDESQRDGTAIENDPVVVFFF